MSYGILYNNPKKFTISVTTGTYNPFWTILTDGLCMYRKGERDGLYVIDFSADGGTTWELDLVQIELDEDTIITDIDAGVAGYRHQIRSCIYCIDHELTPLGFAGAENTDWENIYNTSQI
jgi:hypothetical protein